MFCGAAEAKVGGKSEPPEQTIKPVLAVGGWGLFGEDYK
jgi:hypothetical protein